MVTTDVEEETLGFLQTRTATGREHFACQDRIVSQIFILTISNGEKILSNVNVVVLFENCITFIIVHNKRSPHTDCFFFSPHVYRALAIFRRKLF